MKGVDGPSGTPVLPVSALRQEPATQIGPTHTGSQLSLLAERSVLLTSPQRDGSLRYLLPVTLRAYGRRMLRRLGQEEEFAARHQRWQGGCRPQHDAPAGK